MITDEALVLLAWDAVSSDAALLTLLANLAAAFRCGSAALVYKDSATPAADISLAHGPFADPAVQQCYAETFAALDPAPAALGRLAIGDVADTDALFPMADRGRYRAFLEGFYHPLGLAGALGAPLIKSEARIGMVAVHRDMARHPFDGADLARLRRLVPHLVGMIEMRQTFFALNDKAARLGAALEPLGAAVMVLDSRAILVEANGAARAIFARKDGLMLNRSGHVLAADIAAARELRDAMTSTQGERLVRAPRGAGPSDYVLRVRRQHLPAGWTITVSDPDRAARPDPLRLASAFGLTPNAAALLAALVEGETMNAFCARRSMSRNTAKYHLRAAFTATGTRRQTDLVARATAVARDLDL